MSFRAAGFAFQMIILLGLAVAPIKAELPAGSKSSQACDRVFKAFSNREMLTQLSEKIKIFSSYISRPEFSGKNLPEIMNRMGDSLKADPQLLQAFHKDFNQMMKVFDEFKNRSLAESEAKLAFAVISNQSILSRSFVTSYLIAQATEKFLRDRSVVASQKYYSAEDADVAIYSALTAALNSLDKQDEDWDSNEKETKRITTLDVAKKLVESLEENSMHPDSLLGGTQILRDLFSKDPEIRAKAHRELHEKAERSTHLREVFRKKWLQAPASEPNSK